MIFIIQLVANIIALFITVYFIPGLEFLDAWWYLIISGIILGIVNYCQKLILNLIFPSYIYITLIIFIIPINLCALILIAMYLPSVSVTGLWSAFWAIVIITLTNYSVSTIMNYK